MSMTAHFFLFPSPGRLAISGLVPVLELELELGATADMAECRPVTGSAHATRREKPQLSHFWEAARVTEPETATVMTNAYLVTGGH